MNAKKIILIIVLFSFIGTKLIAGVNDSRIDSVILNVDDYIESVSELRGEQVDDLVEFLEKSDDNLTKCKISNALCWIYFYSDPPKAMKYAKIQMNISEKLNNPDVKIATFDNMAWLSHGFNDNENAILYMLKSLKAKETINDTAGIVVSVSGLASIHLNMKNYKLALKYFTQSYEIEKKRGIKDVENQRRMAVITGNIGLCHTNMGDYDKGLEMYFKTIDLYIGAGLESQASTTYGNVGLIYLNDRKDNSEALKYLLKSAKLHQIEGDVSKLSGVYGALSEVYSNQNNFTNALIYGKKAVRYANLGGDKSDVLESNLSLSKSFYKNKNFQLAYQHFKIAFNMKDTIFSETSSNQIAEMQTKYDTEKKEAENSLLLAEKELDKVELNKKTAQQKMLMIGLFIATLIVVYIAYSLNQKKKTNKLLNTQNEEISLKNEIIEEKNKDITDSINYALRIQDAILPEESIIKNRYESFIYYRPKDIVSGDFYWIKELGNKIYFSVVDCTGHGVPGAFMSIIGANSLNKIVEDLKIEATGEILDELNKLVNKALGNKEGKQKDDILSIRDGMDIIICSIDKTSNELEYSGANNSLYILRNSQNKIDTIEPILENDDSLFFEIKPNKMAIGGGDNKNSYQTHKVQLLKNDTIYLFSDGYADQFGGPKGKKFMYKPFKRMFLSIQDKNMDEQLAFINRTMIEWKGDLAQLDDICVMGVRI